MTSSSAKKNKYTISKVSTKIRRSWSNDLDISCRNSVNNFGLSIPPCRTPNSLFNISLMHDSHLTRHSALENILFIYIYIHYCCLFLCSVTYSRLQCWSVKVVECFRNIKKTIYRGFERHLCWSIMAHIIHILSVVRELLLMLAVLKYTLLCETHWRQRKPFEWLLGENNVM